MSDKNKRSQKLLALDGGGIRGIITLEVLAKLEDDLRASFGGNKTFVLSHYFDYIAGTSTGAMIATCLSLGMRVEDILKFYIECGPDMFDKSAFYSRLHSKYEDEKLAEKLRKVISDQSGEKMSTLGSKKLQTMLMVVLRNATTDSPWPLSNNPNAHYNNDTRPDCNLNLPLWQVVRASTAAPTYFPPEVIDIGKQQFVFVDGGVTMYNNPSFQLFLMATMSQYKLGWQPGEKDMLLVSIGTGAAADANAHLLPGQMNLLYNATSIPSALMFAASNEQDLLCRVFGKCLHGARIDREVLDLIGERGAGPVKDKLFTYVRYNADLSRDGLNAMGLPNIEPKHVQQMDSVKHIGELRQVGKKVAAGIDLRHFEGFLTKRSPAV